jgi:triosephosphate isomerase
MEKPLIIINFKKVSGKNALSLMRNLNCCYEAFREYYKMAVAVQPCDACEISRSTEFSVFVHDIFLETPLYEIVDAGYLRNSRISGVLLNHPENQRMAGALPKNVILARANKLEVIIGATSLREAMVFNAVYFPDYLAIESKELIGKPVSIREKCAGIIEEAVCTIPNRILFGAGVRSDKDVAYIIEKGGSGVLVSSVVVASDDPFRALSELLSAGRLAVEK